MVVLLAPVLNQFLHIGQGYTLIPIGGGFRVGPASMGNAVFRSLICSSLIEIVNGSMSDIDIPLLLRMEFCAFL